MPQNVRLKDIAKKLGVSVTTVSKAIKNHPDISAARKAEVKKMLEELQYVPNSMASILRTNQTRFIGLMISDNTNPYYAQIIKGAEEVLHNQDFFTLICNTRENPELEREFITNLRSINVAGVIITPIGTGDGILKIIQKSNVPYVISSRYVTQGMDNYVIADDYNTSYLAVEHLLARKPDALVVMLNGHIGSSTAKERFTGYRDALAKIAGAKQQPIVYDGIITPEQSYELMPEIFQKYQTPLSILCYSDYVAAGVLAWLEKEQVAVPERVGVIGIDDIDSLGYVNARLSTVAIPKKDLGAKSAELLLDLIAAKKAGQPISSRQIVQPVNLVTRSST